MVTGGGNAGLAAALSAAEALPIRETNFTPAELSGDRWWSLCRRAKLGARGGGTLGARTAPSAERPYQVPSTSCARLDQEAGECLANRQ